MKICELTELAIRLTGLVFIVIALSYVLGFTLTVLACLDPQSRKWVVPQLASYLVMFMDGIMGFLLIKLSKRLSLIMTRGLDQQSQVGFSFEGVQAWSIALVGLAMAATALPRLARLLAERIFDIYHNTYYSSSWPRDHAETVGYIIQFLLGVGIFLGSSGLLGFRRRCRDFGVTKKMGNDSTSAPK
jgi:hypothetical protein